MFVLNYSFGGIQLQKGIVVTKIYEHEREQQKEMVRNTNHAEETLRIKVCVCVPTVLQLLVYYDEKFFLVIKTYVFNLVYNFMVEKKSRL